MSYGLDLFWEITKDKISGIAKENGRRIFRFAFGFPWVEISIGIAYVKIRVTNLQETHRPDLTSLLKSNRDPDGTDRIRSIGNRTNKVL